MNMRLNPRAALQVAVLGLLLVGTALLYGCVAPAAQGPSPAATTQGTVMPTSTAVAAAAGTPTAGPVTDQELASLGCVCHVQGEQGAPPVSALASLPEATIMQTVRQGRGVMPAWSTQSLSDQLLARIVSWEKSGQQGTPGAATTPTP